MAQSKFHEADWIKRLAAALEDVAPTARPQIPDPPGYTRLISFDEYRALADRAKHDPDIRKIFEESHLWLDTDPEEARAILREHPVVRQGLIGSGKDEGIGMAMVSKWFRIDLKSLVLDLAKHAVKASGECAAKLLHRYLTASEAGDLPAHEITVFHGLVVEGRLDLGADAYLAPYEYARVEFDLPDEPELWAKMSYPDAAVLVRSLSYGPGIASDDDRDAPLKIAYRFPTEYQIGLDGWFDEKRLFVALLSIAARVPLLTRTRYVCVAEWVKEINPNFAFYTRDSGGNAHDVWPEGRDLSQDDADAFVALAHG